MKCWFCCSHVSRLESLVFLWLRRVYEGSCKTSPFHRSPTVKIGGSLARNVHFDAPSCLVSSLWFSCVASPCLWGKLQNLSFLEVSKQVVMSFCVAGLTFTNLFYTVSKVSKLEDISHEMFILMLPHVSSRVSGFPVASPCLWGKLQNLSFLEVSKQVVMSFCVAGLTFTNLFYTVSKVSKLEDISHEMFILMLPRVSSRVSGFPVWPRRVYGGSCKTSPFWRFPSRLSCHFAWQVWHLPTCFIPCRRCQNWRTSRTKCSFWCSHMYRLESLVFLWPRRVYGGSCKTSPFWRFPSRLSCHFAWQVWHLPTCFIPCRRCQNWRTSRTKCSFWCSHMYRLESLVFLWPRRVYGGSRLSCHFAWQAWHFLTFSNLFYTVWKVSKLKEVSHEMLVLLLPHVSSRVSGFPVASPCLWGKLQNLSFLEVSKNVVMSLCVAGVALCESSLFYTLYTLRSKLPTLHFTLHTLHFALHTPHPTLYTFHSTLYTVHSTLHTLHSTLYTLHSTLYAFHSSNHTPRSTLYTPHSTLYAPHSTLHNLHSTLYTVHSSLHTSNSTFYTLHSTLHTLHSTLYISHSTLRTPDSTLLYSTLYTLHSTLCTLHSTLYTLHSSHHTPHSTLYSPHSTLHTLHSTLYTSLSTLHTPHFTLYTPHFTLYTLHSTLDTLHSALHTSLHIFTHLYTSLHIFTHLYTSLHIFTHLYTSLHCTLPTSHFTLHTHCTLHTPHSTLYNPHFTLFTPHSTLHTLHSTLLTLHPTLHTPHSTLHTPHSTIFTPHSTLHTLHCRLYTLHSKLHTLHSTLYTLHSTLYTPHFTLYTVRSSLLSPHCTLYTQHSLLYTPHSHSTLVTPHSTLYTLHSTLSTPHSTLHTLHSTLYTLHLTLHTPHSTLYTL